MGGFGATLSHIKSNWRGASALATAGRQTEITNASPSPDLSRATTG